MKTTKAQIEAERQKGERNASEFQDRFAELANHAVRIFGRDAAFVMVIQPPGQPSFLSLGNVSTDGQAEMLRAVLYSFDRGRDLPLIERRVDPLTGKVVNSDPGVQVPATEGSSSVHSGVSKVEG